MDTKHAPAKMTDDLVITPQALEKSLLQKTNNLSSAPYRGTSNEIKTDSDTIAYNSRWGQTIAVGDLQGQTAPEIPRNEKIDFVCMHCLQPAQGFALGNPTAPDLTESGLTVWSVRGWFGSVGCALRYANDHRYSFNQETAGFLPSRTLAGRIASINLFAGRVFSA